jgi:hypothetical protein
MSEKNSQIDYRLSQQNAKDAITRLKDYYLGNNAKSFFTNGNSSEEDKLKEVQLDILTGLLDTTAGAYYLKDIINLEVFDNPSEVEKSEIFKVIHEFSTFDGGLLTRLPSYIYNASVSTLTAQNNATYDPVIKQVESEGELVDATDSDGNVILSPGANQSDQTLQSIVNRGKSPNRFSTPSLGAVEIKNTQFSLGNRNNDLINLFFNAIPPIEMSRAVPFIQFKLITAENPYTKNSLSSPYFFRFLKKSNDGNYELDDEAGLSKGKSYFDQGKLGLNRSLSVSNRGKNFNTAGMELFTSPQTLVNANIRNSDSELFNEEILDPFQPLMTLKSLKFDNSGLGGTLYTSKSATVELILHDRSRLKDVQPLISARDFGLNQVLLEFGWSHPDGGADSNNDFGRIINSLRDVGLYNVQQTDFNIDASGNVNISMTLRCTGLQEFKNVSCAAGYYTPLSILKPQIEQIIESYINNKVQNSDDKTLKEVRKKATITRDSFLSSGAMIKFDQFSELMKSAGFNSGDGDENIDESTFFRNLESLIGIDEEGTTSNEELKNVAVTSIMGKVFTATDSDFTEVIDSDTEATFSDPFLNSVSTGYKNNNYSADAYVSLGKLMLSFVGLSFAGTGRFDEVQLFFYPINSKAGGARRYTTAGFPIDKSTFKELMTKEIQNNPNMTIKSFISLLGKGIINKDDYFVYGIRDQIEAIEELNTQRNEAIKALREDSNFKIDSKDSDKVKEEKRQKYEEAKKEILEDSQAVRDSLSDNLDKKLLDIYTTDGGPTEEAVFKNPIIKYYIENLPVISPDSEQTQFGQKSICRIHIYDKESIVSPFASRLNDIVQTYALSNAIHGTGPTENDLEIEELTESTVSNGRITTKLKQGVGAREIKQKIKKNIANVTLGTSNGVVKSVSVSAKPGGAVGNVLLIGSISDKTKSKTNQAQENFKDDVSVIPGQVSLTCLGNPCIQHASEIYVDFNSGTSLDNIYIVRNVSHTIGQGDFTTTLTLAYTGQGETSSIKKKIEDAKAANETNQSVLSILSTAALSLR